MLRQSFIRSQRLLGLATSTSKRCKLELQNFWCTDGGRLNSTSPASTQSHDANAGLSPATKHDSPRPAILPLASSLPRHSSPDDIVTPTDSTSKGRKRGPARRYAVATLDPTRLDPSCFLDVSGSSHVHIYDHLAPDSPSFLCMIYTHTDTGFEPLPPDTRGFLYFYLDMHNPLLSQIRFRVAQDRDPARSFSSGHDLTYGSGYTWHMTLVNATRNHVLRKMLVRDGLIDDALLAQMHALPPSMGSRRLKRAMSVLNQPFLLDFKNLYLNFVARVAGEDRLYETKGPLIHYEEKSNYRAHDAGAALCRWERSTLPQHAGRRILVMRLLKILQPPKLRPDLLPTYNVSVPAEGELFTSAKGVWYRDVDRRGKCAEILRLLYDASDDGELASS